MTVADPDEGQIRGLIRARMEALKAKDARAAVATLAPDIIAFELGPPLRLEPDQARDLAGLEAWLGMWEELEIEVAALTIHVGGNVAFAHSLNRLTGTRQGGAPVDFWMRSTLGFRKNDGNWVIVHGHSSVPFAMDGSYRAMLDLKP